MSEIEHQRWEYEQNRQIAERWHDRDNDIAIRINEAAINNANIALRALLIINGGAAVAILAFLGSLISSNGDKLTVELANLTAPIEWFAWGVALSPLAMAFAYFTNYCIASGIEHREKLYEHPYIKISTASKRWDMAALVFQAIAIVIAFGSLGCFLGGMYAVREAINGISL